MQLHRRRYDDEMYLHFNLQAREGSPGMMICQSSHLNFQNIGKMSDFIFTFLYEYVNGEQSITNIAFVCE